MAFNATRPELADLNKQLPYPNTMVLRGLDQLEGEVG